MRVSEAIFTKRVNAWHANTGLHGMTVVAGATISDGQDAKKDDEPYEGGDKTEQAILSAKSSSLLFFSNLLKSLDPEFPHLAVE